MSDSSGARKLLWALLVLCVFASLVLVGLIGFLLLRGPSGTTQLPVVNGEPAEKTANASAVPNQTIPIVLSHDVTSEESRLKWGPEVPHGTQVLNQVTFFVDGGLRVAGLTARKHPGALLGIPIRQRGTRIHLLQAAENVGDRESKVPGTIYGRLRFHFGNGQSRDTYLRYGVHGFDWWQVAKQLSNTVSDPNTKDAWVEAKPDGKVFIRLHQTSLANPFPDEEITSFDAISPLARGNLLLFGVSVDSAGGRLAPPVEENWPVDWSHFTFSLKDAQGKPMSGATVQWDVSVTNGTVSFPPFPCDASGQTSIAFATRAIRRIRYTATDVHGIITTGTARPPDAGWSPTQEVTVVMFDKPQ